MEKINIAEYYGDLAQRYDEDRFGQSYGRFLHRREADILARLMPKNAKSSGRGRILDLACGTGRFSFLATDGLDQSREMLSVAREKWPKTTFFEGDARKMPFDDEAFDVIFSLHFLMHLPESEVAEVLEACFRVLKNGGTLIVDFPSRKRRELFRKKMGGWHGATAFDLKSFEKLAGKNWKIVRSEGVLTVPIHRFSPFFRPVLYRIDSFLGRSWVKNGSSYLFVKLEKKS